jgi:cytochrome c553
MEIGDNDSDFNQVDELSLIMEDDMEDMEEPISIEHGISLFLRDVIRSNTNFVVERASPDLINELDAMCEEIKKHIHLSTDKRINEKGTQLEDIIRYLRPDTISRPKTRSGKMKTTGYPDLDYNGQHSAYLEIKLYKRGSEESTFRSFYMSTVDKVTKDQPHILLGFAHEDGILTGDVHVIDLYDQKLKVKVEFNASNNDIYPKIIVKPTYTIQDLDDIKDVSAKRDAMSKYKVLLNNHKLKGGCSADSMYGALHNHVTTYSDVAE